MTLLCAVTEKRGFTRTPEKTYEWCRRGFVQFFSHSLSSTPVSCRLVCVCFSSFFARSDTQSDGRWWLFTFGNTETFQTIVLEIVSKLWNNLKPTSTVTSTREQLVNPEKWYVVLNLAWDNCVLILFFCCGLFIFLSTERCLYNDLKSSVSILTSTGLQYKTDT